MEEKELKKRRKIDKETGVALILVLLLGLGIGYLSGRGEERPDIRIECSDHVE